MYEDFLIGGPAVILAVNYLAPNSDRKGLLKSLRSTDRERAILGVRNAAWDLTLLSHWIDKIQEQERRNELILLCSLDRKVIEFARLLADDSEEESATSSSLRRIFEASWGPETGRRLAALAESYLSNAADPARQLNKPAEAGYVDRLIREGEEFIRNWKR